MRRLSRRLWLVAILTAFAVAAMNLTGIAIADRDQLPNLVEPPLPALCRNNPVSFSEFRPFDKKVWSFDLWERGKPSKKIVSAYKKKLKCAVGPGHEKAMKIRWLHSKHSYRAYRNKKVREQRMMERYTPYSCATGRSAIPCSIMECESGGSYTAKNPSSSAGGKYQILDSTWYDYGGGHYSYDHPAAHAPPAEQDRIASEIWADSGGGAWVCE